VAGPVKISGVVILFEGAAVVATPILGPAGDAVELAERIGAFCSAVLAKPDVACCIAGLHTDHLPGRCARRSTDQVS
jgi:hypothetical protein